MTITKRLRVSFDVKVVFPSEEVQEFIEQLVGNSKRFLAGEKLTGIDLELARVAAQYGPEAAIELSMKSGIQSFLREELARSDATASNIRVEVRQ